MIEQSPYVKQLQLEPHPEGGWYREIWQSNVAIPKEILGAEYNGSRQAASSIYFLLHEGEESIWHKVLSDEIWLYHTGSPVEIQVAKSQGDFEKATTYHLGVDVAKGEQPQVLVKRGEWQRATPLASEASLVSCIVSPAFSFDDFEMIDKNK